MNDLDFDNFSTSGRPLHFSFNKKGDNAIKNNNEGKEGKGGEGGDDESTWEEKEKEKKLASLHILTMDVRWKNKNVKHLSVMFESFKTHHQHILEIDWNSLETRQLFNKYIYKKIHNYLLKS